MRLFPYSHFQNHKGGAKCCLRVLEEELYIFFSNMVLFPEGSRCQHVAGAGRNTFWMYHWFSGWYRADDSGGQKLIQQSKNVIIKVVKFIMACYVEFFRGTPMMAQAMFIYFGSAYLFNINMSMWFAAIFIVSINTGAYMAETVRGGILSIDPGQTEGAKAIGMTHVQTMINVILPQALRNIMPQIRK